MKTSLVATLTGLLAIGSAIPTAAQRPTTCDGPQDACQQIIRSFEQFVTAFNNKDVAGTIMGFTDDAVLMGEGPMLSGKEALPKNYSDGFTAGFTDNVSPIDQIHVVGNMAWAVGSYSVTGPGPNNATQKYATTNMHLDRLHVSHSPGFSAITMAAYPLKEGTFSGTNSGAVTF